MPNTMISAVEDFVCQSKSSGTLLDVNEAADSIIRSQQVTGEHIADEVALALIKAASRRGLAMRFRRD